jgi:hypothetical protein
MLELIAVGIGYIVQSGVISQMLPETVKPIANSLRKHFCKSNDDLQTAIKESFQQTLSILGIGLNPNVLKKLANVAKSPDYKKFYGEFETEYLREFLQERQLSGSLEKNFRHDGACVCQDLLLHINDLLPAIDESQVPDLLFPPSTNHTSDPLYNTAQKGKVLLTRLLEQHGVQGLIREFFTYRDIFYRGVIYFFQNKIKDNSRINAILQAYNQHKIAFDINSLQVNLAQTQQSLLAGQQNIFAQIQALMAKFDQASAQDKLLMHKQMLELQNRQISVIRDLDGLDERMTKAMEAANQFQQELRQFGQRFDGLAQLISGQIEQVMVALDQGFDEVHKHIDQASNKIIKRLEELREELRQPAHIAVSEHRDPFTEFEMAVHIALDDQVIEQSELKMLYALARRWGIEQQRAEDCIRSLAQKLGGRVLWTEEAQHNWERESKPNKDNSHPQLEEELEELFKSWINEEQQIFSDSAQRKFFMEAALRGIAAEYSENLLRLFLNRHGVQLEADVKEHLRQYLASTLQERYLSANEAENVIYSAEQSGLSREQALQLIEEECLKSSCINALQLLMGFERFLNIQLTSPLLKHRDAQRMIQWAISKGLREVEARSFLRKQCRLRQIKIVE